MIHLKKRKLFEGEQTKLHGMQIRLEEQLFAIESASDANLTLETLTMASGASRQAIEETGVTYEELKENIEDQKAQKEQLDALFVESGLGAGGDEIDELTAELDKLAIADAEQKEVDVREQMQKDDALRLDAELAAWEAKVNAMKAKEDQQQLYDQEEQVEAGVQSQNLYA